ncbi:hypothetical protein [Nocardia sp. CDC160]|uniref:hypothetical protein n=1 Tax=Nocardia sp. CDC160 TaxID=3112166 RepID=UPI002DB76A0F|nr:hypothetical protein [Nocardia sp. CDC160]MEC3919743.1 hypothetical protein [Nocardia sp. CDC160]
MLVIVGGDDRTRRYASDNAFGSLRRYGFDWTWDIAWCMGEGEALPMSLSIGLWLATAHGPQGLFVNRFVYQSVSFDATPEECAALGRELADIGERVAMLIVGDGMTGRSSQQVLAAALEDHRFVEHQLCNPASVTARQTVTSWSRQSRA